MVVGEPEKPPPTWECRHTLHTVSTEAQASDGLAHHRGKTEEGAADQQELRRVGDRPIS